MKDSKKVRIVYYIWVMGICCFFIWLITSLVIIPLYEYSIRLNEVCLNEGYDEMTDYHRDFLHQPTTQVECDNEEIFSVGEVCISRNKWGDCEQRGYVTW